MAPTSRLVRCCRADRAPAPLRCDQVQARRDRHAASPGVAARLDGQRVLIECVEEDQRINFSGK